jgi:hypothetical protein
MKKILYLDQFIVSNLSDEVDDFHSGLKNKIISLYEKGLMLCPLSPEHYFESSFRNKEEAVKNDVFLNNISGGKCFFYTIQVHINLMMAIGSGKDFSIDDFIGDAVPNKFNETSFLSRVKSNAASVRREGDRSVEFVNSIRALTKEKAKDYVKSMEYENMKKMMYLRYKAKIVRALNDGYVKIGSEQLGGLQVPDWMDQTLEWLFRMKDLDERGVSKVIDEIILNRFENIPSLYILNCLRSLQAVMHKPVNFGDEIDNDRIAKALYPCDIMVVDSKRKSEVISLGLDKIYGCKVFSGKQNDLSKLDSYLGEIDL